MRSNCKLFWFYLYRKTVQWIPVRLEGESDGFRLTDVTCINRWTVGRDADLLAKSLIHDHHLPSASFYPLITKQVKEQAREFERIMAMEERMLSSQDPNNADFGGSLYGGLRMPIRLDLTIGCLNLQDKFEWSLRPSIKISNHNQQLHEDDDDSIKGYGVEYLADEEPEDCAECMVKELRLPREFVTAIAHGIREQITSVKKALLSSGILLELAGETPVEAKRRVTAVDPDLANLLIFPNQKLHPKSSTSTGETLGSSGEAMLRVPLANISTSRTKLDEWTPLVQELTLAEREKREMSQPSKVRRQDSSLALRNNNHAKHGVKKKGRGRKPKLHHLNHAAQENILTEKHEPLVISNAYTLPRSPPRLIRTMLDKKANSSSFIDPKVDETSAKSGSRRGRPVKKATSASYATANAPTNAGTTTRTIKLSLKPPPSNQPN